MPCVFINIFHKFLAFLRRAIRRQPVQVVVPDIPIFPMTSPSKFKSNWFNWPVDRYGHSFRVFVVEPQEYNPANHTTIFNEALKHLIAPSSPSELLTDLNSGTPKNNQNYSEREPFDLITFPEAFLPKDDLLATLKFIRTPGCIHVGLRPSTDPNRHLFRTDEVRQLVDDIKNVPNIVEEDFVSITEWINDGQNQNQNFNISCLFTVDSKANVRVCLHPKIVSSRLESTPLHDTNMHEADLYSLVTLEPTDNSLLSITIQPLICADALFIGTDRPNHQPLQAVSSFANNFERKPPDQIDIVSVTTYTRQQKDPDVGRKWHQEFRDSFIHATKLLTRHHSTVFILSNYSSFSKFELGGLSGVFMPIPLCDNAYPGDVTVSIYGRPKGNNYSDNVWSFMTATTLNQKINELSSLGYIAAIDSHNNNEIACMLGFTINHLPRHNASWPSAKKIGLRSFTMRVAMNCTGNVVFEKRY